MSVYRHMLSRNLRVVLLLFMLVSQGVAHSHELAADHTFGSQACSSCHMGNGDGAVIAASPTDLHLQSGSAPVPAFEIKYMVSSCASFYFGRAPPQSLNVK